MPPCRSAAPTRPRRACQSLWFRPRERRPYQHPHVARRVSRRVAHERPSSVAFGGAGSASNDWRGQVWRRDLTTPVHVRELAKRGVNRTSCLPVAMSFRAASAPALDQTQREDGHEFAAFFMHPSTQPPFETTLVKPDELIQVHPPRPPPCPLHSTRDQPHLPLAPLQKRRAAPHCRHRWHPPLRV